ncbi:YqiA/YcfP family alpha/beta fold hydrolase [Sulfurimonas sp.]|uniref:YqiA/YcfP family alpha/beta fold hydrolase n=1 Tax=Sulfurimonas sp. TaxID=2022749 RepID=UPI002AB04B34|nr:YqiA/YcfP family alpha/beta fold hydrolase [Sulfurimonas sp.]
MIIYILKTVLLNSSIFSYKTLKNYMGNAPSFYDNSSFTCNINHINMLENYIQEGINKSKFMLLVQKGDELLNTQEAIDKFRDATLIAEEGGNHGFEGIELYFERIRKFIK